MPDDSGSDLQVIATTYDLVLWTCRHLARFPRSFRFTLGDRLERRLYDILDQLIRARYSRDRLPLLHTVNQELELLRFQFRLAKDLRCLALDSYGHPARQVNEIGRMVGGWLKATADRRRQAGPAARETT